MSLHALAHDMASKGRNGDSMLVHMTPSEVAGLHALARSEGTELTINPYTGLPEAFSLSKAFSKFEDSVKGIGRKFDDAVLQPLKPVAPMILGAALAPMTAGTSLAFLGATPMASALTVGAGYTLATGSLSRGLTAGLGAYGGASLYGGITGAGAGAAQQSAISALGPGASQEAINTAAAEATKNYLGMEGATSPLGFGSRLTQGLGAVADNPKAFIQGMGGLGKTLSAVNAAASPMMADQAVQTTTKMPSSDSGSGYKPSPAYYRPYEYDPETKSLKSLGSVKAEGLAAGGAVAFAGGGSAATPFGDMNDPEYARAHNMALGLGGIGRIPITPTQGGFDISSDEERANLAAMFPPNPYTAQQSASGGASDLVYRPLSQVDQKAAQQGIGNDPLNDRMQGLEKVMIDRGLIDELNTYKVNAGGYGKAYNPVGIPESLKTDNALQNAYYDAIRNDLSETERQRSAGNLLDILKQYEDRTRTSTTPPQITSTEAIRPTTEITPSTYTVRGEQIAPQTSTTPPQVTATAAARPVANITPAMLTTQAAAPVPLTSTAPPAITMSAAPTMRSTPVGGGGSAGMAAVRPFDYQSERIEELPEVRQMSAEEAMSGQSLDAYRRLMGIGSAQLTNNTQRGSATSPVRTTAPAGYVTNPFGQQIAADAYKVMNGPEGQNPAFLGVDAGRDPVTGEAYQWAWDKSRNQWHVAKSNKVFAAGGDVPGYAMGGLGDLGGYSDGGRLLRGPGDGVSDSIPATIGGKRPARLADGEFVVPARIVSELGNGSTEAGARKLYAMMDRVQRARGKTTGKKRVAANTRAEQYLPA